IDPRASELGRGHHAEVAVVAELGERVRRPPLLVIHPLLERVQLDASEAVDLLEDLALVVGEPERAGGGRGNGTGHPSRNSSIWETTFSGSSSTNTWPPSLTTWSRASGM